MKSQYSNIKKLNSMNESIIRKLVQAHSKQVPDTLNVVKDTTQFMDLDIGTIMLLDDIPYFILRNEKEIGFGYDNEPKYWVKRATNLFNGQTKIVKLVYFEEFIQKVGDISIKFFRNPQKEADILDSVKNHPDFMHGITVKDVKDNAVRIIDYIQGRTINNIVTGKQLPHDNYFFEIMPEILSQVSNCFLSLSWLHDQGLVHGDVRWDHILFDRERSRYRWIDFDYDYIFPENPFGVDLFGVGKILAYIVGKGPHLYSDIKNNPKFGRVLNSLSIEDFSVLQQNLLLNIKKLYPYVPNRLNNILLHFSGHSNYFYNSTHQIVDDLEDALRDFDK